MFHCLRRVLPHIAVSAAIFLSPVAYAETVPGTDFNLHFESANIVGSGRSINVHRVPVVTDSTGQISYFDISFKLSMDDNQQLIFDDFSQITSASLNSADNFIPGAYIDQDGNTYVVSGGGIINDRTSWNIRSTTDGSGHLFNANWVSGEPSGNPLLVGNPLIELIVEGPSYGTVGRENISIFSTGGVIGVLQSGNSISITSHASGSGAVIGTLIITRDNDI